MTFTTPQQSASAVIGRVFVSLGVLALGAVAFRLSLRPVAASAANPVVQTFTQREALNGARAVQINLNGDVADLNMGAADLPGEALRGSLRLPGSVTRQAARAGNVLDLTYTERTRTGFTGGGTTLRLDGNGLHLDDASNPPVGRWNLSLNRALPTRLNLKLISGDTRLNLADTKLTALTLGSQSGDLTATLPASLSGDVQVSSNSGDLSASFEGTAGTGRGDQTFSSITRSGDQRLDLRQSRFGQVRIESVSGDVKVTLPDRPDVRSELKIAAGDTDLTVGAQARSGSLTLTGVGGDLRLRVPPGLPVRVRTQQLVGDLSSPSGWVSQAGESRSPAARDGQRALEVSLQKVAGDVTIEETGKEVAQ